MNKRDAEWYDATTRFFMQVHGCVGGPLRAALLDCAGRLLLLYRKDKPRTVEAVRRLMSGETETGIARSWGVSRQRVHQVLYPERTRCLKARHRKKTHAETG